MRDKVVTKWLHIYHFSTHYVTNGLGD